MKTKGTYPLLAAAMTCLFAACSSDTPDEPGQRPEQGGIMNFAVGIADSDGKPASRHLDNQGESNFDFDSYIHYDASSFDRLDPSMRIFISDPDGQGFYHKKWLAKYTLPGQQAASWNISDHVGGSPLDMANMQHSPLYWANRPVNFFALAGDMQCWGMEGGGSDLTEKNNEFVSESGSGAGHIETTCLHPRDILWARHLNVSMPAGGAPVPLTFNHAMAQLRFRVKNINPNINVEVTHIAVYNINTRGLLHIPKDGNQAAYWTCDANNDGFYRNKLDINDGIQPIYLHGASNDFTKVIVKGKRCEYYLLALPQTVQPLTPEILRTWGTYNQPVRGSFNRQPSYLAIRCKITNRDGGQVVFETNDYERNGVHYFDGVLLPLTNDLTNPITWEPNKRYTYNIVFGEGGGWTEEGKPTLVPINISATVSNFQSGGDIIIPSLGGS